MNICKIDGCGKPVHGRGWCGKHYSRWLRGKDLTEKTKFDKTIDELFLEKVNIASADECWEWQNGKCSFGYGTFWNGIRVDLSHRYAYQYFIGPIPDEACVLHKCDNPPCCNPAHLFLGTKLDNHRDMVAKGRQVIVNVKGSRHGHAKLDESDVLAIRDLIATGSSHTELAKVFGVSRSAISLIHERKTWTHI